MKTGGEVSEFVPLGHGSFLPERTGGGNAEGWRFAHRTVAHVTAGIPRHFRGPPERGPDTDTNRHLLCRSSAEFSGPGARFRQQNPQTIEPLITRWIEVADTGPARRIWPQSLFSVAPFDGSAGAPALNAHS